MEAKSKKFIMLPTCEAKMLLSLEDKGFLQTSGKGTSLNLEELSESHY